MFVKLGETEDYHFLSAVASHDGIWLGHLKDFITESAWEGELFIKNDESKIGSIFFNGWKGEVKKKKMAAWQISNRGGLLF